MNTFGAFPAGTLVRQKKRRRQMVVLEADATSVTCGWSANGKFHTRRFAPDALRVMTPWSAFWPVS